MGNIWFFEKVDLIEMLCPHRYAEYLATHEMYSYGKNEFIYMENAPANKVYLVADGKVKIAYYTEEGEEIVKAILTKGELFGEMALLGEEKRSDFAQSLDDRTSICPMSVELLSELMRKSAVFSLKVHKVVGSRMKCLERRLDLLLFKDTKTRLIEFIKELKDYQGVKQGAEILIRHHFTQKDIADLIGTTRPTVNALLNELRKQNTIEMERGKIRIKEEAVFN